MKKLISILLVCVLTFSIAALPGAALEGKPTISRNEDGGIFISGFAKAFTDVSVMVYKESIAPQNTMYMNQTSSDRNGKFEISFQMPVDAPSGTYRVSVQARGEAAFCTDFSYTKSTLHISQKNGKVTVSGIMDAYREFVLVVYEATLAPQNLRYMNQGMSTPDGKYSMTFELPESCEGKTLTFLVQQQGEVLVRQEYTYTRINDDRVWWHGFIKTVADNAIELGADALVGSAVGWDAGAGAYYTANEISDSGFRQTQNGLKANGVKRIGWIEGCGDTRVMAGAVNKLADGSYELNADTGAAVLHATPWNWPSKSPSVSPSANECVWLSAAAMVNKEAYQGEYVWPEEAPLPTYPDGRSALGWLDGDQTDPRNYKLYDAMAQKDIDGNLFISEPSRLSAEDTDNFKIYDAREDCYTRNFYFSKDMASPWWIEYNRYAVRRLLEDGVDGFWVDNYNGWNYCDAWTTRCGFGDWSVAKFRDYLAAHPEVGIADTGSFDVRAYMKEKEASWGWTSEKWLSDPVWVAYKAFKADILSTRMTELYNVIKEEAVRAGRNPDDILVMGNDISKYDFGGVRGTVLDMVSTEYTSHSNSTWNYQYPDKLAPDGYSSVQYKIAASLGSFGRANIWQYPHDVANTMYAKLYGYEALANNTTLYLGASAGSNKYYGDASSTKAVFDTIDAVSDMFGERESSANIALVYSPQSEGFAIRPHLAGTVVSHRLELNGWGYALEDAKIPYMIIPDYKLSADSLAQVELLVLPDVLSISDELINQVIIPYIENGGKVIITGADSGLYRTSEQMWQKRESAALADLGDMDFDAGQVIYTPDMVGFDYFTAADRTPLRIFSSGSGEVNISEGFTAEQPEFIRNNGMVRTDLSLTNNTQENVSVTAYFASYSEGRLTGIAERKAVLAAGKRTDISFDEILSGDEEKIFVWKEHHMPIGISLSSDLYHEGTPIGKLMAESGVSAVAKLYGFGERVTIATHKDEINKSYFVDLVNRDVDAGTNTVTPSSGGTVKVQLPYAYENTECVITLSGSNAPEKADFIMTGEKSAEVYVPEFDGYVSMVFREAK